MLTLILRHSYPDLHPQDDLLIWLQTKTPVKADGVLRTGHERSVLLVEHDASMYVGIYPATEVHGLGWFHLQYAERFDTLSFRLITGRMVIDHDCLHALDGIAALCVTSEEFL